MLSFSVDLQLPSWSFLTIVIQFAKMICAAFYGRFVAISPCFKLTSFFMLIVWFLLRDKSVICRGSSKGGLGCDPPPPFKSLPPQMKLMMPIFQQKYMLLHHCDCKCKFVSCQLCPPWLLHSGIARPAAGHWCYQEENPAEIALLLFICNICWHVRQRISQRQKL